MYVQANAWLPALGCVSQFLAHPCRAISGRADATLINGTATLNSIGSTLNNGTDLSNTTSISVATFELVAETGNATLPLFTSEPGTTFDLTNLSGLSFGVGHPIDFTATSGAIIL